MNNEFNEAIQLFENNFKSIPMHKFVSYGRLEVCGNHTDHNHGLCLVATCSLSIKAAVIKCDEVHVVTKEYGSFSFSLNDLSKKDNQKSTSIALTKGVIFKLKQLGYKVGGFKAALTSNIFAGAGVSSSAAFELLIGEIINRLYNDDKIDRLTLAKVGQFAENEYFGKCSGLLDQCGSSFGGLSLLDFKDMDNVRVSNLKFPHWPIRIFLVNPGMSHQHMDDLYASIPNDMKKVAKYFGQEFLRDVDKIDFKQLYKTKELTHTEVDRAKHFFDENNRVLLMKKAIESEDLPSFLKIIAMMEESQEKYLKNVMVPHHYAHSPLEAVRKANEVLSSKSCRVMGGGFAGSIICYVKNNEVEKFVKHMSKYYSSIVEVSIPDIGAHEVKGV